MRHFIVFFLFIVSFNSVANDDLKEFGRSLANYQSCSDVAVSIDDKPMFSYYRQMFNDGRLSLLSYSNLQASIVYSTWAISEITLSKIDERNLELLCLSRFDTLLRKMQKGEKEGHN